MAGPAPGPRYSSVCAALACRFFNPPDEEGEDYKGGRDLDSLRKFASTELGPGCSVDTLENCDDAQKARPHPPPHTFPITLSLPLHHHPPPLPSPFPFTITLTPRSTFTLSLPTLHHSHASRPRPHQAELEKYIAMPADERDTKLTELKKAMADAEEEHNALLKTLQSTFKESQARPPPPPVCPSSPRAC